MTFLEGHSKFVSLSVTTTGVHSVHYEYKGILKMLNFTVSRGSNSINVDSLHRTSNQPTSGTVKTLQSFTPDKVFACENGTIYLHQKNNFILALGYTRRFPLKVESRTTSTLQIHWKQAPPSPPNPLHRVSLYRPHLNALIALSEDTTPSHSHRFGDLEPCLQYVACMEPADGASVLCLSALTDPDMPTNFRATTWSSRSVTVEWECPLTNPALSPASFLITVFHLNGTGHILEEKVHRHDLDDFVFTVGNLPPCSKVKVGLQAMCQSQGLSRDSKMLISDGNAANSDILDLHQTSFGPNNYTVSWSVRTLSSISSFRVYHQGELQSSTLITSHTVTGLLPCQRYICKVEAVCGDDTVMSVMTVKTRTGPSTVSELQFRQEDSTAEWSPASAPGVAFLYMLSLEVDGPDIRRGRVMESTLPLLGLELGQSYKLEVMEECKGGPQGPPTTLCFVKEEVPIRPRVAASVNQTTDDVAFKVDFPNEELVLVVPWILPSSLRDPNSEPRAELEYIISNKLHYILRAYRQGADVQVVSFEDFENGTKTKITFETFEISRPDDIVSLSAEEQLRYMDSLNHAHITVKDRLIYMDDPDECNIPGLSKCGPHSVCVNTLDSFTCLCETGYYDVSPFLGPSCHEKGMFTLCKMDHTAGGISKQFLIQYFGGDVTVTLNDGRCSINETEKFYYYRLNGPPTQCGAQKHINQTHMNLENTLTVTLSSESVITRKDLKVLWICTYPRMAVSKAHMQPDLDWFNSHTMVQFNSSWLLEFSMALFTDASFTYNYTGVVELSSADYLFLQVTLHSEETLAYDMTLEVESCWATETPNPQEERKAFFLKEGCPADKTFHWYLPNGSQKKSRFSIQMFSMSTRKSLIYLHCVARMCTQDENCTTMCPVRKSEKVRRDLRSKVAAIVSAGPITVHSDGADRKPPTWIGPMAVLAVVGGAIGLLVLTALAVHVAKTLVEHQLRRQ
ncbi:hypothetical protein JZ751_016043 [Albula glossodonta]|uniref:Uromodulin-like 1 n=1 Tax=Albula glossodonta TaxID=121402 RepID=A0A8T2NSS1_9TELE|nr:hypothetical protein JZ751_016043 [Albula glossodonta]